MAVSLNTALGAYPIAALAGTNYVPLAGGTMTGALTIASGTLTASAPALSITQTWNNAAVTFDADTTSVTNTASLSTSTVKKWVVGGTTVAAVYASGVIKSEVSSIQGYNVEVHSTVGAFSWAGGSLSLFRDAAATLAQRNGTTQQIFRLYNTYTDSSNYERLTLTGVAGASVNLTAETLGTGGDNLDIVLTPAGTGAVRFPSSSSITSDGFALITGMKCALVGAFNYYAAGARFSSTSELAWTSGDTNAAVDVALFREAAGQAKVTDGGSNYRDLKLRNLIQTEYSQLTEMTAPAAPAANSVRIYAEDNGAGKTRLMALFATGSAVQLGIEP